MKVLFCMRRCGTWWSPGGGILKLSANICIFWLQVLGYKAGSSSYMSTGLEISLGGGGGGRWRGRGLRSLARIFSPAHTNVHFILQKMWQYIVGSFLWYPLGFHDCVVTFDTISSETYYTHFYIVLLSDVGVTVCLCPYPIFMMIKCIHIWSLNQCLI